MSETLGGVVDWIDAERVLQTLRALAYLVLGWMLASLLSRGVTRLVRTRVGAHEKLLLRRGVFWPVFALFAMASLHQLGFQLGVLLGAAGVLTVAIGFASQTSASNLVSGLFLIVERSFEVGDVIRVGATTGEVLSIDLLSVKLRTFDNLFVRLPNESLIKTECTNLTRFPIRRIDLPISIAYGSDVESVREVLLEIADREPLCLEEPAPLFIVGAYAESAIELQLSVWVTREAFLELRNRLRIEIKKRFEREGIEIPFPQRRIHVTAAPSGAGEPLPGPGGAS